MKKIYMFFICFIFCYTSSSLAQTYVVTETIRTPNNSKVPDTRKLISSDVVYNSAQLAVLINDLDANYNGAQLVASPSFKYNCHAYAWHVSEGGEKVWIGYETVTAEDIYWIDESYVETSENQATKVSYHQEGNHSAIRLNSSWYQSKWGASALVKHHPNDVPSIYKPNKVKKYYKKNQNSAQYTIIGSNTICDQETYTIENLPSSATVLWSTSNTKLQLLSGQGTGAAVFKKNSSGESIIKAKIMVNGSVVANLETKTIICGTPFSNSISVDIFGQFNDELFNPSPQNYICMDSPNLLVVKYKNSDPELYDISEAEWNILEEGSLWYFEPYFPSGTSYDYPFDIIFTDGQNSAYPPPFTVRLRNKCGWSAPIPLQFMVKNCNNNLSYFLSPNGDGINDIWEPYKPTRKGKSPSFNVGVFNKKGDIVYQKDNYMQDKERFYGVGNYGKYNGKTLPAGDYFFTITGSIAASGHIYIKRE